VVVSFCAEAGVRSVSSADDFTGVRLSKGFNVFVALLNVDFF